MHYPSKHLCILMVHYLQQFSEKGAEKELFVCYLGENYISLES